MGGQRLRGNAHTSSTLEALQVAKSAPRPAGVQVEWEERWWEASDWGGMREMGAEKSGCGIDGSAWRETWREAIAYDEATGEPLVERSAHKWAHTGSVRPPVTAAAPIAVPDRSV